MPGISYKEYFKYAVNSDADTFLQHSLGQGTEQGEMRLKFATNPRPTELTRIAYSASDTVEIITKTWTDPLPIFLQSGMEVGMVALINHNIPAGATITVETFEDNNGVTPDYSETFSAPLRLGEDWPYMMQSMYLPLATKQVDMFKVIVRISYPDAKNDNLDLGRLWIGNYMSVDNNSGDGGFDGDWDLAIDDGGDVSESIGKDAYLKEGERQQEMDFPFNGIPWDDAVGVSPNGTFQEFLRFSGKSNEVIMLPFDNSDENKLFLGMYGLVTNKPNMNHVSGKFDTTVRIKQLV